MKTLIAYGTKYGSTTKSVETLQKHLKGECTVINLCKEKHPDLDGYQRIILGGSVYMGRIQKEVQQFMQLHEQDLLHKTLGLFLVCGQEDAIEEQAQKIFPAALWAHAASFSHFGYAYMFEKMNFIYRLILKKAAGIQESRWNIKDENIKTFAAAMKG